LPILLKKKKFSADKNEYIVKSFPAQIAPSPTFFGIDA
jgi:hypothetical protein